jgi:hypothetical protein
MANEYPNLGKSYTKRNKFLQVLEVRPVIDWDKGKAVEFLLQSLGLNDPENVIPIYIGDDRTDEDAFKVTKFSRGSCAVVNVTHQLTLNLLSIVLPQVLRQRNCGHGILVSQVPKETDAFYSLRDPSEVRFSCPDPCAWSVSFDPAILIVLLCHAGDGVPQFLGEMEETFVTIM